MVGLNFLLTRLCPFVSRLRLECSTYIGGSAFRGLRYVSLRSEGSKFRRRVPFFFPPDRIVSSQCNSEDAEVALEGFKQKYVAVDLSGGLGGLTGELTRCFIKLVLCPEEYMFSPAAPARARARGSGVQAPTGQRGGRWMGLAGSENPWSKIVSLDTNGESISHPVGLLAVCLGADSESTILRAYSSRARSDISGRNAASRGTFHRL